MTRAETLAEIYFRDYAENPLPDPPRFLSREPIPERDPEYVGLAQFIAGWVAVLALAGLVFWGL